MRWMRVCRSHIGAWPSATPLPMNGTPVGFRPCGWVSVARRGSCGPPTTPHRAIDRELVAVPIANPESIVAKAVTVQYGHALAGQCADALRRRLVTTPRDSDRSRQGETPKSGSTRSARARAEGIAHHLNLSTTGKNT